MVKFNTIKILLEQPIDIKMKLSIFKYDGRYLLYRLFLYPFYGICRDRGRDIKRGRGGTVGQRVVGPWHVTRMINVGEMKGASNRVDGINGRMWLRIECACYVIGEKCISTSIFTSTLPQLHNMNFIRTYYTRTYIYIHIIMHTYLGLIF